MEIEIKLTGATEELFRSVGERLGSYSLSPAERQEIVDTYYETPGMDLVRLGCALRYRSEDGVALYTLKVRGTYEGGVARREETEVAATPENWAMLLERIGAATEPEPCITISTLRLKRTVSLDGRPVAVAAFDRVDYGGGQVFYDVEFELMRGAEEEHLRALALLLPHLRPSEENKLERGLRLRRNG